MNSCPYCGVLNRPGGIQVHMPECEARQHEDTSFGAILLQHTAQAVLLTMLLFVVALLLFGCGGADANFAPGASSRFSPVEPSVPPGSGGGATHFPASGTGGVSNEPDSGVDQPTPPELQAAGGSAATGGSGGATSDAGGPVWTGGVGWTPGLGGGGSAPSSANDAGKLPPCPTWEAACYGQHCGASVTVACATVGGAETFNCSAAGRCPCTALGNGGGSLYCDGPFTYDVECPAGAKPGVPGCVESQFTPGTWCCP